MKYMHFNSSCSYAGLANMLELAGHDTEDYQIALDMRCPYLLHYDQESGYYQTGASLQSAQWFDLYLKPRGFRYYEAFFEKDQVIAHLQPGSMLGILVAPGSRHAVIFLGANDGVYSFLNNKWEQTQEPEQLELSAEELLERLAPTTVIGHIENCPPEPVDHIPYFQKSLTTWEQLRRELHTFVSHPQSPQALREAMNRLFRPLLLDGLTMMQLIKDQEQTARLQALQNAFLTAVKKEENIVLSEHLAPAQIDAAIDHFRQLIRANIQR